MLPIRNAEELAGRGRRELRRAGIEIAAAGLSALDPDCALRSVVQREDNQLRVGGRIHSLDKPVHVLGAGKATLAIARGLEEILGDVLTGGLVVVPRAHAGELSRIGVSVGDHPIPRQGSAEAGARMIEYAAAIDPGSLVLCVFTGGSSALVSTAPEGVPPSAKTGLHELLVGSGLDVVRMNTVRKHVSDIKGGRLAHLLAGCDIVNLTVSDVAGDVLDAITDPTIQDSTRRDHAIAVLVEAGLWEHVDPAIRTHLESERAESPWLEEDRIQTVLVANGHIAGEAMLAQARTLGLDAKLVSTDWGGDAAEFGKHLASLVGDVTNTVLVGCGGETTVRLDGWGSAGKGGPNQELAVAAALALNGSPPTALIAVDTDGSDGGSQYAGGLIDDETQDLWETAGVDARSLLSAHESSLALEAIGQAVFTGPTLTNVNDLFVLVVGQ